MIAKKQVFFFFLTYALLRLFSYFFHPGTFSNTGIAILTLFFTVYFLWRKKEYGWYIIAAEIFLGGTENFLEISGISLRTWLLFVSVLIFVQQKIRDKKIREILTANKTFSVIISILYIWIAFAAARGYFTGHHIKEIWADIIPYLFLLYYFPLAELLQSDKFKKVAFNLLTAAIIGNLVFVLFTFVGYSSELFLLQDSYYHWFRDMANGKITEFDFHFHRLVLNEHLLLIPLILFFIWKLIKKQKNLDLFLSLSLIIILSINFTRAYILALPIGLLFLFNKTQWKRWLAYSAGAIIFFFLSFTLIHFIGSRGQSLGWEFFGIRLQSIAAPQIEDSSLSRMLLLPKIWEKIKTHPLLGNGLGDMVTVYSPALQKNITTPHFDWGYLEIIDELGMIGFAIWIFFIFYCFYLIKSAPLTNKKWLTASLAALLVINVTSPSLFHIMGIIWITAVMAQKKLSNAESGFKAGAKRA